MKMVTPTKNLHIDIKHINQAVQSPQKFIDACENGYIAQLHDLAEKALAKKSKIIMLAGPSSSGKTTTANKLSAHFQSLGVSAPVVSLDDFFLGIANYPKLPDGTPDMEAVEALDLAGINACFQALLQEGIAEFPLFDFETSSRKAETNHIELPPDGILIVEGLHALNPRLFETMNPEDIFLAYVSTRTQFLDGDRVVLTPKDTRLIRRMVRDHNFRGKSPLGTLETWGGVLSGEEKYIYPFRDTADYKIDSSLDYEGCIFHHYIVPIIEELKEQNLLPEKLLDINNILLAFDDIDYEFIPTDSLLREFIGN